MIWTKKTGKCCISPNLNEFSQISSIRKQLFTTFRKNPILLKMKFSSIDLTDTNLLAGYLKQLILNKQATTTIILR